MKKIFTFFVFFMIFFALVSCSIMNDSSNEEFETLKNQVNALSTQNAILLEEETNESNQGLTNENLHQEEADSEIIIPTPTSESLPTSPVQAGQPISYDGWRMTVSPSVKAGEDSSYSAASGTWSYIKITLFITNISKQERVFRWVKSGLTLQDDLGNSYLPLMPYSGKACRENYENLNSTSQLSLNSDESQEIKNYIFWCDHPYTYPYFEGPIDINASSLILSVNNFGPFNGVQIIIDL